MAKPDAPVVATQQPTEGRPYGTRRKSLSLAALGIVLPRSAAQRSQSSNHHINNNNNNTSPDHPPAKRVKRSHTLTSISSSNADSTPQTLQRGSDRARTSGAILEQTPPPSPLDEQQTKIETDGINDDIVVAVLEQLQSTGNRPHLIKELAAVLINKLSTVESSANPTAIISSRLTNYLRRPWTALAPCPLAKEQVVTYPRRVYYFLTTAPRQGLPEFNETPLSAQRIISPSISSGPEEEEEEAAVRSREALSPSPELDLSSADDLSHGHQMSAAPFSDSTSAASLANTAHNRRAVSPPLEHDEREFTHTANIMIQRKHSEQIEQQLSAAATPEAQVDMLEELTDVQEETEESAAQRNHEAAAALFGHNSSLLQSADFSSPILRPMTYGAHLTITPKKHLQVADDVSMVDPFEGWAELKSPENVELAELDDLLGGF